MNTYSVLVPIAGYAMVEVEAENEEEATITALSKDIIVDDIEEWDVYRNITQGNILYPPFNSVEVELIEDPE